jgi:hypothetical protein
MGKWGCQEKHGKTLLLLQGIRMTMKVSGARYGSAPLFDRPTAQLTRTQWAVDGSATEVKIAVAAKFLWHFQNGFSLVSDRTMATTSCCSFSQQQLVCSTMCIFLSEGGSQ